MSHIFARGRGMGPISHGIINADPAAVQVLMIKIRSREKKIKFGNQRTHDAIQLIYALRGFLHGAHTDKTKATRPVRLMWSQIGGTITGYRVKMYPLVINDGHFFNMPKPAELLVEVTFSRADTQPKDTEHAAWVRSLSISISKKKKFLQSTQIQTMGACGGRLGGGEARLEPR